MPTFYKPYSGGAEDGIGTQAEALRKQIESRVGQLTASASKRDIPGNLVPDLYSGRISLEDFETKVLGSPTYDPTKGPQINYGSGPQALTSAQTQALSSGQSISNVANMNLPTSLVTPNDIQNGASKTYTVQSGDTLSQIAARYGVPISSISGYKSGDINKIGVGEVLTIGGKGTNSIDTQAIPTNTIVPTTPIGITTPTTITPSTAGAYGDTVTKTLDQYIKEAQSAQKSAAEVQQDALTARLSELVGQTAGQAQALSAAEADQGVPELTKQLQDINNQIKTTRAEQNALNVDVQGKPITMSSIIGAQAQINAVMDAKIYTLSAQAQALQGNITLAKENAQKAVDLKYAPILEELKIKQAQLELIQPTLTKEEKIKADALAQKNKDEANALAAKMDKEKETYSTLITWQGKYRDAGITPQDTLESANEKIKNSSTYKAEIASLASDVAYKNAQTIKIQKELDSSGITGSASDLMAYAQQYASTGAIPTGLPKGTFGIVAQSAMEIPKSNGTIVNKITGVADSKTPSAEQQDYSRLLNIKNNITRLKELDDKRIGGIIAGTLGKVFGSTVQSEYLSVRKAIVDDMQRMQSGAALTPTETAFYEDYLPGRTSESFFLGQDSAKKIANFESIITNRLNERLDANNLSIIGYSTVEINGQKYKVGEIVTNSQGQIGRVNPNGTITIVQ